MGFLFAFATLLLTVFGQLIIKWRVDEAGELPDSTSGKLDFVTSLVIDPWVILALGAAFVAALCWFAAITQLDLSRAYPVMGLSFAFVLLGSALFFSEPLTAAKVIGTVMICGGVAVATQA